MANEITANQLDSGGVTVDKEFLQAMVLLAPVDQLVEKGIVNVKDVAPGTDKAVFNTIPAISSVTWRVVDQRGSEVSSVGSYQAMSTPSFVEITPLTYSSDWFIHENIDLVNRVSFDDIAKLIANAAAKEKISNAISVLGTVAKYTAATSIKNAGGYTTKATVATDDTLAPLDLIKARKSLKSSLGIAADVVYLAADVLSDLEGHADMSPTATTGYYRKARFSPDGVLVRFDMMEVVESLQMSRLSSGDFASNGGYNTFVGLKGFMCGRAQHKAKDKVRDTYLAYNHGTIRTVDINFAHDVIYPDAIRVLQTYTAP